LRRLPVLILLLGALARGIYLDRAWAPGSHDGWSGAFYSNIARNYLRHGYWETRFAPIVSTGDVPRDHWVYYLTHPPGIGLVVSLSFRWLGEHEWSARLVPLIFSVGSLFLLYRLAQALFTTRIALLATFLAAFVPMEIVYGAHVDPQGPAVTFFSLALLEAYRRGSLPGMIASLVLGSAFDWPIHYMAGLIAFHALVTGGARRREVWVLPLLSVVLVGSFWIYGRRVAPSPEQNYLHASLGAAAALWTGYEVDPTHIQGYRMEWPGWPALASRVWSYYLNLFTWPLLVLAALGVVVALRRRAPAAFFILLLWGLLHAVLFPMGAFVHDYWAVYLTPGLALAAALGLSSIADRGSSSFPPKVLPVLGTTLLVGLAGWWIARGAERIARSRLEEATLGRRLHEITLPQEGILSLLPLDARDAYYADRPVKDGVNRFNLFEAAMADPVVDYRYFMVPAALVHERPGKPLFVFLEAHYPHLTFEGFYLYDLSRDRQPESAY
jgi:4-amino-4-deoxy-L-arabinose transferase-like glycosyltransferase